MLDTNDKAGWSMPGPDQTVSFGLPISEALPHALSKVHGRNIVLATTRSLCGQGGLAEQVAGILAGYELTIVSEISAHTPSGDVIRLAKALAKADGVISLGGGSICDAVKMARLCVVAEAGSCDLDEGLDNLTALSAEPTSTSFLPFISIPTTLSAAEYTPFAGITNEKTAHKRSVSHPRLAPDFIILDGLMGLSTPARLWAATGARAVDHAVETWCSLTATPFSDALAIGALSRLVPALKACLERPTCSQARLDAFVGAWLAIQGLARGIDAGASHGIGHALGGSTGMSHGETSSVMLPHVLRFNASVNRARQQDLARHMGADGDTLADIVGGLFGQLGLPSRLRDAGVQTNQLAQVARQAMDEPWVIANPRHFDDENTMLNLLHSAW